MERTLISWNWPNVITIALMGFGTWAIILAGRQMVMRSGLAGPTGG